jgi:hypothetical protein
MVLKDLQHENIVPVLGQFAYAQKCWGFVLPWLDFELQHYLAPSPSFHSQFPLCQESAVKIVQGLLKGLTYLIQQQVRASF